MKKTAEDVARELAGKIMADAEERVKKEGATGRSRGAIMFNEVVRANKVLKAVGLEPEYVSKK